MKSCNCTQILTLRNYMAKFGYPHLATNNIGLTHQFDQLHGARMKNECMAVARPGLLCGSFGSKRSI